MYPKIGEYQTTLHGQLVTVTVYAPQKSVTPLPFPELRRRLRALDDADGMYGRIADYGGRVNTRPSLGEAS